MILPRPSSMAFRAWEARRVQGGSGCAGRVPRRRARGPFREDDAPQGPLGPQRTREPREGLSRALEAFEASETPKAPSSLSPFGPAGGEGREGPERLEVVSPLEAPQGRPAWAEDPRYREAEGPDGPEGVGGPAWKAHLRDVAFARGPYGGRRGRPWARVYRSPPGRVPSPLSPLSPYGAAGGEALEGPEARPTLTYAQKAALRAHWPGCVAFGGVRAAQRHGPRAWWVPPQALEAWVKASDRSPKAWEGSEGGPGAWGPSSFPSDPSGTAGPPFEAPGLHGREGRGGPREAVKAWKRLHAALAGRTAEVFVGLGVRRGFLPRLYRPVVMRVAFMEAGVEAAFRRFAPRRHRRYRAAGGDLARFYRRRRGRYPWRFVTWGVPARERVNPMPDPLREARKVQRMLRWVWWRDTFMRAKPKHALTAQAPYLGRARRVREAASGPQGPGAPGLPGAPGGGAGAGPYVLPSMRPFRPPRPREGPRTGPSRVGGRPTPGQAWVSPQAWDALLKRHRAEGTFWDRTRRKKPPRR